MILYFVPGACSLADHIALLAEGLPHQLVGVERVLASDGRGKLTADGRDFLVINPKGYVPALELADGTVLTENLAILAYIAEQGGTLLPADGLLRWRALEAVAFMTTELHGGFKPLFYPDTPETEKVKARESLLRRFATLAEQLGEREFLVGDRMTIADPYLFVMLMWAGNFGLELSPRFATYMARMKQQPAVAKALAAEGLAA